MIKAPDSQALYDLMWSDRPNDAQVWGKDRFKKLYDLIGTFDIRGKHILDACCGMGAKSYACLELDAKVTSHDGSNEGPKHLLARVKDKSAIYEKDAADNLWLIEPDNTSLTIVPGVDIKYICNCLDDKKFDIVYMGYALHHLNDPDQAIRDLQKLTKQGGLIAVSYFVEGVTSQLTKDLREISMSLPVDEIADITARLGRRPGYAKTEFLCDMLKSPGDSQTLIALQGLLDKKHYSILDVENALHIEDMLTPHLKNLSRAHVAKVFSENCDVIYDKPGLIRVIKK